MKATELRIGNWVQSIDLDAWHINWPEPGKPYQVDLFTFELLNGIDGFTECLIEPIPLTEEWLEKFGFGRVFGMMCYGNIEVEKYSDKPCIWEVWFDWEFADGKIPIAQIKYVHQLQNLYFALSGEELEIKNP